MSDFTTSSLIDINICNLIGRITGNGKFRDLRRYTDNAKFFEKIKVSPIFTNVGLYNKIIYSKDISNPYLINYIYIKIHGNEYTNEVTIRLYLGNTSSYRYQCSTLICYISPDDETIEIPSSLNKALGNAEQSYLELTADEMHALIGELELDYKIKPFKLHYYTTSSPRFGEDFVSIDKIRESIEDVRKCVIQNTPNTHFVVKTKTTNKKHYADPKFKIKEIEKHKLTLSVISKELTSL